MLYLGNFLILLFSILQFAIVIRALVSWFPVRPDNPFIIVLDQITEPVVGPIRRITPRLGMIDISPIIALLVLRLLQEATERMILSQLY